MREFKSTEELIDFAIGEEQEAADFYTKLSEKVKSTALIKMFQEFSEEELQHKSKLENIKMGSLEFLPAAAVLDLGLGDILVDIAPTAGMDYQEALILAMKKEKAAFQMYTSLAEVATDSAVKNILLGLANQEANHKLRFEIEYDEHVLTEN